MLSAAQSLEGRVVLISPHFDDVVLSLGASAARCARSGARLTVLTVFPGDPDSRSPANAWNARSGFRTAGEAALVRRGEDAYACRLIGATPLLLWSRDGKSDLDDELLSELLGASLADADIVLIPGFPLTNPEHVRVSRAVLAAAPPNVRLGLYTEQPYAWWHRRERERRHPPSEVTELDARNLSWEPLKAGWPDRYRKVRACKAYKSQIFQFGRMSTLRTLLYEVRRGGELVAWLHR